MAHIACKAHQRRVIFDDEFGVIHRNGDRSKCTSLLFTSGGKMRMRRALMRISRERKS